MGAGGGLLKVKSSSFAENFLSSLPNSSPFVDLGAFFLFNFGLNSILQPLTSQLNRQIQFYCEKKWKTNRSTKPVASF